MPAIDPMNTVGVALNMRGGAGVPSSIPGTSAAEQNVRSKLARAMRRYPATWRASEHSWQLALSDGKLAARVTTSARGTHV